jgi:DNA-binding winged helix-turn-helix (wHTH) protein
MMSAEPVAAGADGPRVVNVGDLRVDLLDRTVQRGSCSLPVSGRSFQLLQFLIERFPETASHREILERVWSGVVVTADAISQRVRLLRKALGDERGDAGYIVSVHGQGYRLALAPVPARSAEDRVQARLADRRIVTWLVLAAAILLLLILLNFPMAHALKHYVRHLL